MRRLRLALAIVVVVACATTCSSDPPAGPSPGDGNPIVRLQIEGSTTVAPGETTQLVLMVEYTDGSRRDQTAAARWMSGTFDVATVSGQGRFLGRKNGESFIGAQFDGRTAGRELIVVPTGTFRVTGRVREPDIDAGIAGARVEVRDGSNNAPSTQTDAAGFFKLYGVKPEADLVVTHSGYLETTKHVTIDTHSTINVELLLAGPRPHLNGTYKATFDFDSSSCSSRYEPGLQQRVYTAVVTQTGFDLLVRFIEPVFMQNSVGRGNLMTGHVDPGGVVLVSDGGFYYYYYGPSSLASLVEILPDNRKLVMAGTARLALAGSGFSGPITGGGVSIYGEKYPFDGWIAGCSRGVVSFEKR